MQDGRCRHGVEDGPLRAGVAAEEDGDHLPVRVEDGAAAGSPWRSGRTVPPACRCRRRTQPGRAARGSVPSSGKPTSITGVPGARVSARRLSPRTVGTAPTMPSTLIAARSHSPRRDNPCAPHLRRPGELHGDAALPGPDHVAAGDQHTVRAHGERRPCGDLPVLSLHVDARHRQPVAPLHRHGRRRLHRGYRHGRHGGDEAAGAAAGMPVTDGRVVGRVPWRTAMSRDRGRGAAAGARAAGAAEDPGGAATGREAAEGARGGAWGGGRVQPRDDVPALMLHGGGRIRGRGTAREMVRPGGIGEQHACGRRDGHGTHAHAPCALPRSERGGRVRVAELHHGTRGAEGDAVAVAPRRPPSGGR
jgi:hypothetical protein